MSECSQIQKEEIEVLQSIFCETFKFLKPPGKDEDTSLFSIVLKHDRTLYNDDLTKNKINDHENTTISQNPTLTLRIQLPTEYPNKPPIVRIEDVYGMSQSQVNHLEKLLKNEMIKKTGQVMIHDLAVIAELYLLDVQPDGESQYLADEKARFLEQRRKNMLKEKEDIIEKIRALPSSSNNIKSHQSSSYIVLNDGESFHKCDLASHHACEIIPFETFLSNTISTTRIYRGECTRHEILNRKSRDSFTTNNNDLPLHWIYRTWYSGLNESNGKTVLICEYTIPLLQSTTTTTAIDNQLNQIKLQMRQFYHHHNSLVQNKSKNFLSIGQHVLPCIGLRWTTITPTSTANNNSSFYLIQALYSWESGAVLLQQSDFIKMKNKSGQIGRLNDKVLREFFRQMLFALEYLQQFGFHHGYIQPNAIAIFHSNTFKLMGCFLDDCIVTLFDEIFQQAEPQIIKSPICKDLDSISKLDVFCLALSLMEIQTESNLRDVDSIDYSVIENPALRDLLNICLSNKDNDIYTLRQHEYLAVGAFKLNDTPIPTLPEQEKKQPQLHQRVDMNYAKYISKNKQISSHLTDQFEIIESLGHGGFGDVLRVTHKLDRNDYAIKRIDLTNKSPKTVAKVCSEAKLLSNLRHENIVRYYSAWTEKNKIERNRTTSSSTNHIAVTSPELLNVAFQQDYFNKNKFGVRRVPQQCSIDDLIEFAADSNNSNKRDNLIEEFESISTAFDLVHSSSSSSSDDIDDDDDNSSQFSDAEDQDTKLYLLIQMEYCQKRTLHDVIIDGQLYCDRERLWRYLREILSGLVYIHDQFIYHRDLKPANVFIDSDDHIKIGDFGLAMFSQNKAIKFENNGESFCEKHSIGTSHTHSLDDINNPVGTRLYAAPEVLELVGKKRHSRKKHGGVNGPSEAPISIYTDKVDMFSLGVIFFEMCYQPIKTQMEQTKIITELRQDIIVPDDFPIEERGEKMKILRCLLQASPLCRSSARELMLSGILPSTNRLEDQFMEQVNLAMRHPDSFSYQILVDKLLSRKATTPDDWMYDFDIVSTQRTLEGLTARSRLPKRKMTTSGGFDEEKTTTSEISLLHQFIPSCGINHLLDSEFSEGTNWRLRRCFIEKDIIQRLENLFTRHGAVPFHPPFLLPRQANAALSDVVTHRRGKTVDFIDSSGFPISLPSTLRLPFARYASKDSLRRVKRYQISPVFQRCNMKNYHPRSFTEIAFDILTPDPCDFAYTEIFVIIQEIITELPVLKGNIYVLRVNHLDIIRGLLFNVGIPKSCHIALCNMLTEFRLDSNGRVIAPEEFKKLNIPDSLLERIKDYMSIEGSLDEVSKLLEPVILSGSEGSACVQRGIKEIQRAFKYFQAYFVDSNATFQIRFTLSLTQQVYLYSGLLIQLVSVKNAIFDVKNKTIKDSAILLDTIVNNKETNATTTTLTTSTSITSTTTTAAAAASTTSTYADELTTVNKVKKNADVVSVSHSGDGVKHNDDELDDDNNRNLTHPWAAKRYRAQDIILCGGQYDNRNLSAVIVPSDDVEHHDVVKPWFALGFTLCLEGLLQRVNRSARILGESVYSRHVLVAVAGSHREPCRIGMIHVLKTLWHRRISADVLMHTSNMEVIQQHCARLGIPFIVYVKEDGQQIVYLLKSLRLTEDACGVCVESDKKFHDVNELIRYLLQHRLLSHVVREIDSTVQSRERHLSKRETSSTAQSSNHDYFIAERDLFHVVVIMPKSRTFERKHAEDMVNNQLSSLKQVFLAQRCETVITVIATEVVDAFIDHLVLHVRPNMDFKSFIRVFDEAKRHAKPKELAYDIMNEVKSLISRRQRIVVLFSRLTLHFGVVFLPAEL